MVRLRGFSVVMTAAALLAGCGEGGNAPEAGPNGDEIPADGSFTISLANSSYALQPNSTGAVEVTVTRAAGFEGVVRVAAENLPAGIRAEELVLDAASDRGWLAFEATADAVPGASVVRIGGLADAAEPSYADLSLALAGNAGSLDETFGENGRRTVAAGDQDVWDLAVQEDGRIVVAGTEVRDGRAGVTVFRLLADGSLDASFGDAGTTFFHVGTGAAGAAAVEIGEGGRIVVAGSAAGSLLAARLDANGALDSSFSTDGIAVLEATTGLDAAHALVLEPNGAVSLGGECGGDLCVARFDAAGNADGSFGGGDGWNALDLGGSDAALDVVRQDDGKLVVAGRGAALSRYAVARFLPNGTIDATFAHGGSTLTDAVGEAHALALQADGRIVVTGADFLVYRFDTTGAIDGSFGDSGVATAAYLGRAHDVTVQDDGRIVVFGYGDPGDSEPHTDFVAVRLLADGVQDSSFAGGRVTVDFGTSMDTGLVVERLPDGRAILLGTTASETGSQVAIARLWL